MKFSTDLEVQNPSPKGTSHEVEGTTTDIQEQNMLMEETLEVDDLDAEKNGDDLASVEGAFLEARSQKEDVGRDDESPQEEQSIPISTTNEGPRTSLLGSSTPQNELINEVCSSPDQEERTMIHESAGNEAGNECSDLDHEEKPMINELGNGDTNNTICVDQGQEIKSSDPIIGAGLKENGDEVAEKQDENEATDGNVLENVESEASPTENDHETPEKCVLEPPSSIEIDTEEAKASPISKESESKENSDAKMLETEANQSYNGAKVELRKSPSFDFGISFDTRSEDSDQTPLLYQDKTARRSLSMCSNLSFQCTSIQKEYAVKPLQFEAVPVEEKTILMERSNSKAPPSQVMKNNQENGSNASPTRDGGGAEISSKGNERRKTRSSLFTTCICCTAAIS